MAFFLIVAETTVFSIIVIQIMLFHHCYSATFGMTKSRVVSIEMRLTCLAFSIECFCDVNTSNFKLFTCIIRTFAKFA